MSQTPLFAYHWAVCLLGTGEVKKAIEWFTPLSQGAEEGAVRASFHLGLAHLRLQDLEASEAHFKRVVADSEDPELIAEAKRRIRGIERGRTGLKRLDLIARARIAHDDNVVLEPEDIDVAEKEAGWVGSLYMRAFFRPLILPRGFVGAGYTGKVSLHLTSEEELREFDLLKNAVDLRTRWNLYRGIVALYGGVNAYYSHMLLDWTRYQDRAAISPYVDLFETASTATRLGYEFRRDWFDQIPEKDGSRHEGFLSQYIFLRERQGTAQIGGRYLQFDAADIYYDYRGAGGELSVDARIFWRIHGIGAVDYEYRDYLHHPDEREDQRLTAYGAVYYKFPAHWRLVLDYRFQRNNSLESYQYKKNVIGFYGEFRY